MREALIVLAACGGALAVLSLGYLAACAGAQRWLTFREWWGTARMPDPAAGQVWRSGYSGRAFRVATVRRSDCGKLWHINLQHEDGGGFIPIPMSYCMFPSQWQRMLRAEARQLMGGGSIEPSEPWPRGGASLAPTDDWRPINSAPRDGSNILLRFGIDGVSQGKFVPGGVTHPWKFIDTNDGITWLVNHAVDGPGGPSHWQPMPSAIRGVKGNAK